MAEVAERSRQMLDTRLLLGVHLVLYSPTAPSAPKARGKSQDHQVQPTGRASQTYLFLLVCASLLSVGSPNKWLKANIQLGGKGRPLWKKASGLKSKKRAK